MTGRQRAYLLMLLSSLPPGERNNKLKSEIKNFGIVNHELENEINNIETSFEYGIRNLNANQLTNILTQIQQNGLNVDSIMNRLDFYEIDNAYIKNIIQFLQDYVQAGEPVDVDSLDAGFRGVQVASRDDFNSIINHGWTGDWDLNPDNIEPRRVQVASMNENGPFPRGCYLNADIVSIEPIPYPEKIRYRLFINNPIIINSGNRNVRFTAQPVRYIR